MRMMKEKFIVNDMHCASCEQKLENELQKLDGVINVTAIYKETCIYVEYDADICNFDHMKKTLDKEGYTLKRYKKNALEIKNILGIMLVATVIIILGNYSGSFNMDDKLQSEVTFFVLFIVGLFTSLHCVGMCGGIMLSQCVRSENNSKFQAMKPALLYNLGRVISYTILGGVIGAIGSVFSISLQVKSAITIFAGAFMMIMGLNMAGFKIVRKFHIKLPWSACSVKNKSKTPFVVGILNGFMPCGPLQTMQLYALGMGSAFKGAASMFFFSLGTVPLMLSFGLATGVLSKGYSKKILKFSGLLVVFLGLVMTNRGLALTGINLLPKISVSTAGIKNADSDFNKAEIKDGVQVIRMTANYSGYTPNVLYVQKGVPVKWIINGEELTSCNNAIIVPGMNIQKKLQAGENIIEFTPGDDDINFSCWMGMIRGVIKVTDNLDTVDATNVASAVPPSTSSCCSIGNNEEPVSASIYGDDISQVPTERLIKKTIIKDGIQIASIKGIGYELDPLVLVATKNIETSLNFDFKSYDAPNENIDIVDVSSKKVLKTIETNNEMSNITLQFENTGGYALFQGAYLIGVIEVVDNMDSVDLEKIRREYIGK
ncbi:sulfite exporter TauE/SafE family protein [Lutibacter sp. B2]|nr:sulfite exporter TauE/SafE family protein [Lutibacter sp. B2]